MLFCVMAKQSKVLVLVLLLVCLFSQSFDWIFSYHRAVSEVSDQQPWGLLPPPRQELKAVVGGHHQERISSLERQPIEEFEPSSSSYVRTERTKCPAVIRNQQVKYGRELLVHTKGLVSWMDVRGGRYDTGGTSIQEDLRRQRLRNTVLLTSSNHQFLPFLSNWEILSAEKGLKWALLAFDNETYASRGGPNNNSLLLSPEYQPEGDVGTFKTKSYNKLVCNKIRMVRDVLRDYSVDVLFSDADNVFLKDPFQHELGTMILSRKYDYIYSPDDGFRPSPRTHGCMITGRATGSVNTGFHYLRSSKSMDRILDKTIRRCDYPNNTWDDQHIFWEEMRKEIEQKTMKHCPPHAYRKFNQTASPAADSNNEEIGALCCMDPYYYPTGKTQPNETAVDKLVVFHANWVRGDDMKKQRLRDWTNGRGWRLD